MISPLLEAMVSYFDDETPLPAYVDDTAGGLLLAPAPEGVTGDYVTYTIVSARSERDMSSSLEDCLIQFSVWSDKASPETAVGIAEVLMGWFDDHQFTLGGHTCVWTTRQGHGLMADPDGGWHYHIGYSILVQED